MINSLGPKKLLKKQIFGKKKANFPVKKRLWPIFLVFSGVTILKGQCVMVQKVFRQFFWKLFDNVLGPEGR